MVVDEFGEHGDEVVAVIAEIAVAVPDSEGVVRSL